MALERLLSTLEAKRAKERHARLAAVAKQRRQQARRSRVTKAKLVEQKRLLTKQSVCGEKLLIDEDLEARHRPLKGEFGSSLFDSRID